MSHTDKISQHTATILSLRPTSQVEYDSAKKVALMTAAMSPTSYDRFLDLAREKGKVAGTANGKGFKALHDELGTVASRILAEGSEA